MQATDLSLIAFNSHCALPVAALGKAAEEGKLKVYEKFPHGICTTHADVVNLELLAFIAG
jgi:hypothetical protein